MSIENLIERLTAAIEANTGAVIALLNHNGEKTFAAGGAVHVVNAGGMNTGALIPGPIPAEPDPAAGQKATGRGRRPTRYWKLADGSAVKSSAEEAPSAGAVEVTKDEYERLNHERSTAAHVAQTTPQASEDPFGDAPAAAAAPAVTMDDVRTVALAYRDKHGPEAAKAIIKRIGGVDSLKDAPEATWSKLVAAFNGQDELDL